jgi:hypothetical protein
MHYKMFNVMYQRGDMLDHLQWETLETLETRRNKLKLVMFYKMVNGSVDFPADKYLTANMRQTKAGGK